jgi:hypothetical protein
MKSSASAGTDSPPVRAGATHDSNTGAGPFSRPGSPETAGAAAGCSSNVQIPRPLDTVAVEVTPKLLNPAAPITKPGTDTLPKTVPDGSVTAQSNGRMLVPGAPATIRLTAKTLKSTAGSVEP